MTDGTSTCCDCHYSFPTGTNGRHDCASVLKQRLGLLEQELERANARIEILRGDVQALCVGGCEDAQEWCRQIVALRDDVDRLTAEKIRLSGHYPSLAVAKARLEATEHTRGKRIVEALAAVRKARDGA